MIRAKGVESDDLKDITGGEIFFPGSTETDCSIIAGTYFILTSSAGNLFTQDKFRQQRVYKKDFETIEFWNR
jgi:hypothetical protein